MSAPLDPQTSIGVIDIILIALSAVCTLFLMAVTAIAYFIRTDTQDMKSGIKEIRDDNKKLHDADSAIRAEAAAAAALIRSDLEAHKAACEARRSVDPHLHHRITDHITP